MNTATGSGTSAGGVEQHAPMAKRGRGHPRGSKNRTTLAREVAAAAAQERATRSRAAPGNAADAVALDAALRGRHAWKEGEGRFLPTPVLRAPETAAAASLPSGEVKLLDDDFPVFNFLVPLGRNGQSRLPLPVQFELIFEKYIHGSATVREASLQQRSWSVKLERDSDRRAILAEG